YIANAQTGIVVLAGAVEALIDGNQIVGATSGVVVDEKAPSCFIVRNCVRGTSGTVAYLIPAGSSYGPIAQVADAGDISRIPGAARVLRLGHCAVVALPAAGLVARVGRPGYSPERLDAELRIARHLARAGLPVLAPADAVRTRPIATGHGPVTFWPLVEHIGG